MKRSKKSYGRHVKVYGEHVKQYAYLCNGEACSKQCAKMTPEERAKQYCHHTHDERFAKNKVRRDRKFKLDHGAMMEVE